MNSSKKRKDVESECVFAEYFLLTKLGPVIAFMLQIDQVQLDIRFQHCR